MDSFKTVLDQDQRFSYLEEQKQHWIGQFKMMWESFHDNKGSAPEALPKLENSATPSAESTGHKGKQAAAEIPRAMHPIWMHKSTGHK